MNLALLVKTLGMFFIRKMLLDLALNIVEDAIQKGAAKSAVTWDDEFAKSFSENKQELKKVIQGVL